MDEKADKEMWIRSITYMQGPAGQDIGAARARKAHESMLVFTRTIQYLLSRRWISLSNCFECSSSNYTSSIILSFGWSWVHSILRFIFERANILLDSWYYPIEVRVHTYFFRQMSSSIDDRCFRC